MGASMSREGVLLYIQARGFAGQGQVGHSLLTKTVGGRHSLVEAANLELLKLLYLLVERTRG